MNSTWVKFFTDGTQERGSDVDIARGKASWSKGRLDNIKEVVLTEGFTTGRLKIEDTQWHQFDKFIVPVVSGNHRPQRTHRVVQAKIQDEHVGLFVELKGIGAITVCDLVEEETKSTGEEKIIESDVGLWITLILPSRGKPYIAIAERGKIKEKD